MSVSRKPQQPRGASGGLVWLPLLALTVVIGCSGAEATVSGTVTLDGTPLEHGDVTFHPLDSKGRAAAGSITSGGYYSVEAGQSGGLPAGKYGVEVTARGPSTPNPHGGPPAPGKLLTPPKYAARDTSGLSFDVTPGSNEIDLQLTSPDANPRR